MLLTHKVAKLQRFKICKVLTLSNKKRKEKASHKKLTIIKEHSYSYHSRVAETENCQNQALIMIKMVIGPMNHITGPRQLMI